MISDALKNCDELVGYIQGLAPAMRSRQFAEAMAVQLKILFALV